MAESHTRASAFCRAFNYDPLALLLDRHKRSDDEEIRFRIELELLPYCYPKLRPVDPAVTEKISKRDPAKSALDLLVTFVRSSDVPLELRLRSAQEILRGGGQETPELAQIISEVQLAIKPKHPG